MITDNAQPLMYDDAKDIYISNNFIVIQLYMQYVAFAASIVKSYSITLDPDDPNECDACPKICTPNPPIDPASFEFNVSGFSDTNVNELIDDIDDIDADDNDNDDNDDDDPPEPPEYND